MSDGQSVPAFTMLTVPAGPDVAPLHDRQIVILERRDWAAWLDCQTPAQALLKSSAAGVLSVVAAPRAARPAGLFEGPAPASRPVQN
jgi:putative SOS response-associated peptidase YedK